ncbi:choline/glycine/proline betaine transport protein [Halopseudomonas xinjiangensis]|uniref:Choline/glycine/proline betaine transport protein n=1 Tax=Halopseudomonas xinjiangensis TaxID=487184 RepID=A0A1H1PBG7_9GAMM|nr:choline BCCT transporter BetT [Halopseudomonas xinjiangensis]SDS07949.1 choline/glycine/proline betaine transport protein [Halopseudomonas xinjiangensis]
MQEKPTSTLNPPVFFGSAALIFALVLYSVVLPEQAQVVFGELQSWIITNVGWIYILAVAGILLTVVLVAVSRFGDIKLGPDHSEPDYRRPTWFAMLFSAGMGIGLMFFGVAEPVMHFLDPPAGEGGTAAAARDAMRITFFHWGLHAWAIYAIVALILAYFSYRHRLPLTLRSALYPLIGDRIYGPIGHAVDIFAIISTLLGVATSLGLGVSQINTGLNHLYGLPISVPVQVGLIVATTALATVSVVTGLDKGVRRLSEVNLILAVILLAFVLIAGPTVFILQTFVQNTGGYLSNLVNTTFNLYAYEPNDWIGGWTLFYWGWWLAWSPFVGLFIARISRGRTIREFVTGVLLVPTGFTLFWMTVFGDTAIHMILWGQVEGLGQAIEANSALALFAFLEEFPFASVFSLIAILMVVVFFVTSADSGALVVDLLASGGVSPTPVWQRLFWATSMGVVAIALLLADGLTALQTATIASALPFTLVLMLCIVGLLKALRLDATKRDLRYQTPTTSPTTSTASGGWRRRLHNMVRFPNEPEVERFLTEVVQPACEAINGEFDAEGFETRVSRGEDSRVRLEILHQGETDFVYEVRPRAYERPSLTSVNDDENTADEYYRAEVYLNEGGQNYDVMGWSRDEVIGDILDQYERHMHFLHVVR